MRKVPISKLRVLIIACLSMAIATMAGCPPASSPSNDDDQPSNAGCVFWAVDLDQQDAQNDPASARSEEHTSELQSLLPT
jgi:hypothetical protein